MTVCLTALACLSTVGCADEQTPGARVVDVIDGDTVEVERLGRVRLVGVDTPEKGRCGDDAATRFTREQLLDEVVEVELGVDPRDRYGRALAYLSRDERMHNLALLQQGYARVLTIPPNDKYEPQFEQAERQARPAEAGSLESCETRRERVLLRRERAEASAARAAAEARARARQARRAARAAARREARRAGAAARRRAEAAREREFAVPEEDSGGGGGGSGGGGDDAGGSCLPSSACPGKRDGDGDGCYCE